MRVCTIGRNGCPVTGAHERLGAVILAIDLGKTSCRAAARGRRSEGPGAPGLAAPGGMRAAEAAILAVAREFDPPDEVIVGAAGALAAPDAARALGDALLAVAAGEARRGDQRRRDRTRGRTGREARSRTDRGHRRRSGRDRRGRHAADRRRLGPVAGRRGWRRVDRHRRACARRCAPTTAAARPPRCSTPPAPASAHRRPGPRSSPAPPRSHPSRPTSSPRRTTPRRWRSSAPPPRRSPRPPARSGMDRWRWSGVWRGWRRCARGSTSSRPPAMRSMARCGWGRSTSRT